LAHGFRGFRTWLGLAPWVLGGGRKSWRQKRGGEGCSIHGGQEAERVIGKDQEQGVPSQGMPTGTQAPHVGATAFSSTTTQ
jgi:hypothetical protein